MSKNVYLSFQGKNELRIDWIQCNETIGKLGLTILPGRQDRNRSLDDDIKIFKKEKVNTIYCLAEQWELDDFGVADLIFKYHQSSLEAFHTPAVDQKTLTQGETHRLIIDIHGTLMQNKNVVVHCIGGLGRSGTLAACYLKQQGYTSEEAIVQIRKDRSPRSIENVDQENFINDYEPHN